MSDSKKIEDGGPAFPPSAFLNAKDQITYGYDGMSLRDYAAIHADVPWNAVIETLRLLGNEKPTIQEIADYRAQVKYVEADAMIAARKGGA